jgi:hypothetical protein
VSAIGGILVLMEGASKLSNGSYSLEDKYLQIPGFANVAGLVVGFVFATWFMLANIWSHDEPKPQNIKVQGILGVGSVPVAKQPSK